MKTIVSAEQLSSRLGDDRLALIDTRFYLAEPDRGEREYRLGHIPGAVYAHVDRDLSGPLTGDNGRHPLPGIDAMAETFSRWGVDDETQVVTYDTASGFIAARLWWMLRYLGHDRVAVLDGGLGAWQQASGALEAGDETRSRREFKPRPREEWLIRTKDLVDAHRFSLIDARAPERFRGELEPLDPVGGHIPSARNHFCKTNLNAEGRFLAPEELRSQLSPLLSPDGASETVNYCGSGITACHNLLAMEIAGLSGGRLYAGSWSEWCASPSRPVATGDD